MAYAVQRSLSNTPEISSHPTLCLLGLPLEIRRKIYQLVLPCQNAPPQSASWSTIVGIPNAWMSLLLVNQQISGEAREVLYGDNAFTVAVSTDQISFLHHSEIMKFFRPFKATHSICYIKNWQFDLQFDRSYDGDNCEYSMLAPHLGSSLADDRYYIGEGLLGVSAVLAEQCTDLQTLKVRVPCLCRKDGSTPVAGVQDAVTESLEPLKMLRFKGTVTFIAAPREEEKNVGIWDPRCWKTATTQCQRPACVAFADSFVDIKQILRDQTLPPLLLTSRQQQWLDLKQRAAKLLPKSEPPLRAHLYGVWTAMVTNTDEDFRSKVDVAVWWIDHQFNRQVTDGRYSRYSVFRGWGIPEEEWF